MERSSGLDSPVCLRNIGSGNLGGPDWPPILIVEEGDLSGAATPGGAIGGGIGGGSGEKDAEGGFNLFDGNIGKPVLGALNSSRSTA